MWQLITFENFWPFPACECVLPSKYCESLWVVAKDEKVQHFRLKTMGHLRPIITVKKTFLD